MAKIVGEHGGKARKIGQSGVYIVDLPANASEKAVAQRLANNPHLKFAELDRRVSPAFAVNDPYAGSEWHLGKIGAPLAWDVAQGAGVTIAILDSGVDTSHPDLSAHIIAGWNSYASNSDISDVTGHGTAVAGAAAATSNNGVGVASVAGQARIMPVRITDGSGNAYWSSIAAGLTYAADHGARVANLSYGGCAASSTVQTAAQYLKNKGGLLVTAAGNNGINENITPTTAMISVSATDNNDAITSWSSYGSFVTVAAPGLGIWTTAMGGIYQAWWGTSLATPVTAGVLALMMSANPQLSNTQVESLLYSTAIDLGPAGRDVYYGYGRVNAAGAVQAAKAAVATSSGDTQPPVVSISAPLASATVSGLVPVNVSATDNVGVSKVELRVNGALVATDTATPYGFTWDSTKLANGLTSLSATAYDTAGHSTASSPVSVNVANASTITSTPTPLAVTVVNPLAGTVNGTVSVTTSATDGSNIGISQSLYIDGVLKATGSGASISYKWNTRKASPGSHTISVTAKDTAGRSASSSRQVIIQ